MEKNGYTWKIYDNQEVLLDLDLLMRQDLIIPAGQWARSMPQQGQTL
ncbi:MAG: hypothetical protein ACLVAW_03665 [Eisenbergiella massiliensis]